MPAIAIHPEVESALASNRPVVALESAVITCGLPRDPYRIDPALRQLAPDWKDHQPLNLEIGRAMSKAVRDGGGVPALIALIDGVLHIGLDDRDLSKLAEHAYAGKAASADLAAMMTGRKTAGTTVSATLAACGLARSQNAENQSITVFATGGIGGVHRGWAKHPDISTDLRAIASTPLCVVSAGAKSILDLSATLEALQMLGVPVVGYKTNWFPQFYSDGVPVAGEPSAGRAPLRLAAHVDDPASAARLCHTHWNTLRINTGVLLCNPIPRQFSVDHLEIELAITEAERLAEHRRITGPQRTPFLLNELARLTEGRSLRANIALLLNNAALAAQVAKAIAGISTDDAN